MNKFRIKKIVDNWDIGAFYALVSIILIVGISNVLYWTAVQRQAESLGLALDFKLIKYVTIMEVSYEKADAESRRILVVEDNNGKRSFLIQYVPLPPNVDQVPLKGERWRVKPDTFGGFLLAHKFEEKKLETKSQKPLKREEIWYTIGDK